MGTKYVKVDRETPMLLPPDLRDWVADNELAREVGLLKLGTVSVDGTKIAALAAKKRTLRREQLQEQLAALRREVDALLVRADQADGRGEADGTTLPVELASRQRRLERLRAAQAVLEQRDDGDTVNPGDPDSGITPTAQGPFIQATNDRRQLVPTLEAIPRELGQPDIALADTGYDNSAQIEQLTQRGIKVYCPPQNVAAKPPRDSSGPRGRIWRQRRTRRDELDQPAGQRLYRRRAASSEPCFHVIKRLMGFGRFSLRGLKGVNLEWNLVALAYNCRKITRALA